MTIYNDGPPGVPGGGPPPPGVPGGGPPVPKHVSAWVRNAPSTFPSADQSADAQSLVVTDTTLQWEGISRRDGSTASDRKVPKYWSFSRPLWGSRGAKTNQSPLVKPIGNVTPTQNESV
jgi:hypothetical protein